ncbi:MAG: T9SS type A sorting domain-containing protein [Bacteroidales bacterium]|nr:T9SS type A sorting domain-containing protein [Bacteroidales bacterium]
MRKLLLIFALSMSTFFTAQAGYVIRGILVTNPLLDSLMNYTLTFDGNDRPIAAGSVHSTYGVGNGRNSIVIVHESTLAAQVFPIPLGYEPNVHDIEVRDFQKVIGNEYVLCGSRRIGGTNSAFVAVLDGTFTTMDFYEYPEADMFYSIWADNPLSPFYPALDYYVCGTQGNKGVIASINRFTLQFTNFYITNDSQDWEYHKIIAKQNTDYTLRFVASGRNPDCTQIGFTTFTPPFNTITGYAWSQPTELDSHCVVSDDILNNNTVILASSKQNIVTLNPVTLPLVSPLLRAYRLLVPPATSSLCLQDIGTIQVAANNFRISVAGYVRTDSQHRAWHGYTMGVLSNTSTLTNNFYYDTDKQYEHYKIRYDQTTGKEYTGGYYQDNISMRVLFGSPLNILEPCDHIMTSPISNIETLLWGSFNLDPYPTALFTISTLLYSPEDMDVYDDCGDLKSATAPEYAMPSPEDESDIIALQDRIIVRDVPLNTNYQIYSVIGQLIQTGTTTPDISTAQLGKGVYILRLENGKTFKFVR